MTGAIREASAAGAFGIGIIPETLLIDGVAPLQADGPIAEAAELLHDRDLLHVAGLGEVQADAVIRLLRLLSLDAAVRRRRGGPERIWAEDGHASLILEQLDCERLFAREEGEVPDPESTDIDALTFL